MRIKSGPSWCRPGAWLCGLVLAGALLLEAAPGVARAADDSNIPGVPLPGSVVSGLLGGPIYDHVYSIDVPAQRILLISLIGAQGTDFDLYLFNSTATTIFSTQGQVATSKGPTSRESITYTVAGAERYYIDLNGATDVQGTFRLTVQVLQDSTPPRATLVLDGGAPATRDPAVTATVVATDDLAGVDAMQFSVDGTNWVEWQTYAPTILWSFPNTDGPIRLWVRVRDRAGNVSTGADATIVLDTVPPSIVKVDPPPGGSSGGLQPEIRVTFSEPLLASSWMTAGLIVQDPHDLVIYGTYSVDPSGTVGIFRPGAPLSAGATYVISLGSITDPAGNRVAPVDSWTLRAVAVPTITLKASALIVSPGASVKLTGTIDGRAGGPLLLEQSVAGGPWEESAPIVESTTTSIQASLRVPTNTSFRLHYIGNDVSGDASSPVVRVLVRRGVSLARVSSSVTHVSSRGRTRTLTATLSPGSPQVAVTLKVYRYDATRRSYVLRSSIVRTSAGGTAAFAWRPTVSGRYLLRLTTPPTPLYANGISASYRWDIR